MKKRALFFMAEGFEDAEAVITIDLLRRAQIDVSVVGISEQVVRGSRGMTITTDTTLSRVNTIGDAIILPGGQPGTRNLSESPVLLKLIHDYHHQGQLCAAICAAPYVLYKAGVLKEHRFTCFPGTESTIHDGHFVKENVVKDKNIITSRAVGTAIDFALACISYLTDNSTADKVAESILFQTNR